MKKIKKPKKSVQKTFTESQVGALLEDMNDNIKIIAENQVGINKKLEEHDRRFDNLEGGFESFQKETRENFKLVFDQIINMDNRLDNIESRLDSIESEIKEIKEKISGKNEKKQIEKRIIFLEKELASLKASVMKN